MEERPSWCILFVSLELHRTFINSYAHCAILLWILHVEAVRKFETKLRFDVYVDPLHRQEARFLQFAEEGSTLKYFVDNVMDDFVAILDSRGIYVTINGINIFLCLLRFFKAADFQPKLGIVTRTVGKSFQELAHFLRYYPWSVSCT